VGGVSGGLGVVGGGVSRGRADGGLKPFGFARPFAIDAQRASGNLGSGWG
jgi:hypothetical protein